MRRVGAVLVAAALLVGCSASGSDEATSSTTVPTTEADGGAPATTAAPDDDAGPVPAADWSDCGRGFECTTIEVPLDYEDPEGETIEIAVTRHPAEDPDRRIGTLIMNPGGPGGSAIELAQSFLRGGELGDRFDIVGFDPRGVGASSPLDCDSHLQEMYDADPSIDSEADRTETLETSQAFVDECAERYGEILPFLGTTDVARDMDEVRKVLGEEQVNYLGYSYGTSLGQEYARLFPERVRTMVLDGVVDHEPDGLTTATGQAAGFETALASYAENCAEEGCGFAGTAEEAIAEVSAAAERAPIPAPGADRPATPGVVSLALAQALYSETLWGSLSSALRDALDGDGTGMVELADMYLGRDGDGYDGGFEVYFAVSCLDESWPADPDEVIAAADAAAAEAPTFGSPIVIDYLRCSLWPAEAKPLEPVPSDLEGLPPVLVISTTNDPATPYENGVRVAEQIPGAVLVTNEGEGHTIVGQGKPCIEDIFLAYLVDEELPADGTTCP